MSSSEEFASSRFEIAQEPADEVVLRRAAVETRGLQPEDLGVLAALLLRDPRLPSTMEAIRKDLAAQGWRMGKDRYNAVADRLTKAGHLTRVPGYDEAERRPTWVTRVFRNPANNTQYIDLGISATRQVSAEVLETRDSQSPGLRVSRDSPGQTRIAGFPQSGPESRETRDSETRDSPGQSRNAGNPRSAPHPPHPPEEEDSSSPYPLINPAGSLPSQREEEAADFTQEETTTAERFLQQMKQWQAGAATARKCAPRLLRAMRTQGWPALTGLDDEHLALLEAEILKNTRGAHSWTKCLPGWVDDLRLYGRARSRPGAAPGAGGRERCPDHPARYRDGCLDCAMTVPA